MHQWYDDSFGQRLRINLPGVGHVLGLGSTSDGGMKARVDPTQLLTLTLTLTPTRTPNGPGTGQERGCVPFECF